MVIKETVKETIEKEKLKAITCDICGSNIDLGKSMIGDLMDSNCCKVDMVIKDRRGDMKEITQFYVCNNCIQKFKNKHKNVKFIKI